ncbi:MAG: YfcE family phosphodiesterase [Clostridia bacterium]|nr:YfcE family phosphodiesterase [Clostridia bacterium]
MKYMIASDFHSHYDAFEKFFKRVEEEKPNEIIFLGDLVKEYDYMWFNNMISNIYIPIITVLGNCDREYSIDLLNIGNQGYLYSESANNRTTYFTHGHIYNPGSLPSQIIKGDILFYGHRHIPLIQSINGMIFVCVGSVAEPRQSSNPTYCIYDLEKIQLKDINTKEVIKELIL